MTLTSEERASLEEMIRKGTAAACKLTHARILLKAASAAGGPGWPDQQISAALEVSTGTVQRIRQLFVEEGVTAALHPRPAPHPRWDGPGAPDRPGMQPTARWTLRLLAETCVELAYVDTISHETVRQVLKKVNCARGGRTNSAFHRAQMGSS